MKNRIVKKLIKKQPLINAYIKSMYEWIHAFERFKEIEQKDEVHYIAMNLQKRHIEWNYQQIKKHGKKVPTKNLNKHIRTFQTDRITLLLREIFQTDRITKINS